MHPARRWLTTPVLGTAVAVVLVALLASAQFAVFWRATSGPEGYDESRAHFNTKNTTRVLGDDAEAVAGRVASAVYPATEDANRPDLILLYEPDDWRSALRATSLLRPLNAVLLPSGPAAAERVEALSPRGSDLAGGARVLTLGPAQPPAGIEAGTLDPADVAGLLEAAGRPASRTLLVDADAPETALLAAPWAAASGDLVLLAGDPADPVGDVYVLGDVDYGGEIADRISGGSPAALSVAFAKYAAAGDSTMGWGMNGGTLSGYRAYTIARVDQPELAIQSANLARRGKPGPLLWTDSARELPQVVNNYLWSQRAAFWQVPNEGPFHHFWVLGSLRDISFPAQGQADYAVEIGPYRMKGPALAGLDMLSTVWVAIGAASMLWVAVHGARFMPHLHWVMRLAWPLLAFMFGPLGIPLYVLAYRWPVIDHDGMRMWDRPLWLQGLVATASAVGFGGLIMVATGWVMTAIGLPLIPNEAPVLFWLGTPMVLVMIASYVVAVLVSWLLFQAPMLGMFHGRGYRAGLLPSLPVVMASMAAVSLAMFPGMWWLMMWSLPMMPSEESILWFGVMFLTVVMGFFIAWPANYLFVRTHVKSGMM